MESQPSNEDRQAMIPDSAALTDPVCDALVAKMRKIVLAKLEQDYIWMPKAGVNQIADHVASALQQGIMAQQPLMAASKSRMNILKLPLELRELIYLPVLDDHTDGYRRVHIPITPNSSSYGSSSSSSESLFPTDSLRTPALLQTSQQVRRDTESLYYSTTEFTTSWPLHQFYFGAPADVAQRWLRHIGPRCRSMIKKFVICIEHGEHDELERRMKVMADIKKSGQLQDPSRSRRRNRRPLAENVSLPKKLRTTVEWILEYLQLNTEGLGEGVLQIEYPVPYGADELGEVMSNSEVFCPFCYGLGEPDSAEFLGGVCVDCERSKTYGNMQIGSWKASDRIY